MIVLASKSASRQVMLRNAGVAFEAVPAGIDERAVEAQLADGGPAVIVRGLAEEKALAVAKHHPGRLVLGSDSLVTVEGRRFDKPESREAAAEHLRFFSGRQMELHSAASLIRDGERLWCYHAVAVLVVRHLSDEFIHSYLDAEWPEVGQCVGVFRIEGRGAQLFETISGDMFTVLGMPLLPVLGALRDQGELPA
jgi:septum formation protein